jgi:non-specific serine/threonine protein kinase
LQQSSLAVHLAGAAAALRARIGAPLADNAQARLDRWLIGARRALGEATSAKAWNAGWAMSAEHAVQVALQPVVLGASAAHAKPAGEANVLSPREREVAALIAQGYTNHQIGSELVITEATAASHVVHILAKLSFNSRAQIAAWVVEQNLVRTKLGGSPRATVH